LCDRRTRHATGYTPDCAAFLQVGPHVESESGNGSAARTGPPAAPIRKIPCRQPIAGNLR